MKLYIEVHMTSVARAWPSPISDVFYYFNFNILIVLINIFIMPDFLIY